VLNWQGSLTARKRDLPGDLEVGSDEHEVAFKELKAAVEALGVRVDDWGLSTQYATPESQLPSNVIGC
jgi:hypothetical protein